MNRYVRIDPIEQGSRKDIKYLFHGWGTIPYPEKEVDDDDVFVTVAIVENLESNRIYNFSPESVTFLNREESLSFESETKAKGISIPDLQQKFI